MPTPNIRQQRRSDLKRGGVERCEVARTTGIHNRQAEQNIEHPGGHGEIYRFQPSGFRVS